MTDPKDLTKKFWSHLKSDRTVMLGLEQFEHNHARPMTAQFEEEGGPIWFFTSKDTAIAQHLDKAAPGFFTFTSKGHDIFAIVHGTVAAGNDPAVIDRLWNPFIAAWYEGGKTDPKLLLLRFDPGPAEIWLNASSLMAGIKILLGSDPKEDYKDHVAKVRL